MNDGPQDRASESAHTPPQSGFAVPDQPPAPPAPAAPWASAPPPVPAHTPAPVPSSPPAPAAIHTAGADADTPAPARPASGHGWRTWLVRSVVAAVMLALIGVSAYLVVVSRQWSDRVDELTAISQDLGQKVAQEQAAKEEAQTQADDVQAQLDTLKGRVTELANSEANAVDSQATLTNYLDAMISCADNRANLINGYGGRWQGDDGQVISTRQYAAELTEYCDSVKQNYADFKAGTAE